jgi:hypothetical protein
MDGYSEELQIVLEHLQQAANILWPEDFDDSPPEMLRKTETMRRQMLLTLSQFKHYLLRE